MPTVLLPQSYNLSSTFSLLKPSFLLLKIYSKLLYMHRVRLYPHSQPSATTEGKYKQFTKWKHLGSSFLEALLFLFPSLVIKVHGDTAVVVSWFLRQACIFGPSGPLFQLVLPVMNPINKHPFLEKVRASTSLRLKKGNVTHSHLAGRQNEA